MCGVVGRQHDFEEEFAKLSDGLIPPCEVYRAMDGKLTGGDLSDAGNAFAKEYFDVEQYLEDCEEALLPTLHHVTDSWENCDRLKPILDGRLAAWGAEAIER